MLLVKSRRVLLWVVLGLALSCLQGIWVEQKLSVVLASTFLVGVVLHIVDDRRLLVHWWFDGLNVH